jgi:hypothetical protein
MTISGGDGERDMEWQAILDCWRPPHRPGDWVSPALWDVLELAAAEPLLRRLFPWTAMNELHVSTTGDFRDYRNEPFPAIAASTTCGFLVMTHPWGLDHVVLETRDPAVALECMVRLTREVFSSDPSGDAGVSA